MPALSQTRRKQASSVCRFTRRNGAAPFGRDQQALHVRPGGAGRERLLCEDARALDRLGQAGLASTAAVGEVEEAAQGLGEPGDGAVGVTAAADPGDERLVDLGDGQGRQGVTRCAEVIQERLDSGAISIDGTGRQASFTAEVVGPVELRTPAGSRRAARQQGRHTESAFPDGILFVCP